MHEILSALNSFIDSLGKVDPVWYTVIVGPLAAFLQHALKKEREYTKPQNIFIWLGITAVMGAFWAIMRSATVNTFVSNFGAEYPQLALAAYLVYRAVFEKYEELTAATTLAPAAAVPDQTTAQPETVNV
jgi:hypothetical protein